MIKQINTVPAQPGYDNDDYEIEILNKYEVDQIKDGLQTDIDAVAGDVGGLDTRVNNLETRVGTAETDIDNLETRVETAETDIDNLEGRVDTAETDIDVLEEKVAILPKTFEDTSTGWKVSDENGAELFEHDDKSQASDIVTQIRDTDTVSAEVVEGKIELTATSGVQSITGATGLDTNLVTGGDTATPHINRDDNKVDRTVRVGPGDVNESQISNGGSGIGAVVTDGQTNRVTYMQVTQGRIDIARTGAISNSYELFTQLGQISSLATQVSNKMDKVAPYIMPGTLAEIDSTGQVIPANKTLAEIQDDVDGAVVTAAAYTDEQINIEKADREGADSAEQEARIAGDEALDRDKINYSDIVDDLTTGGTDVPGSAEQLKILAAMIGSGSADSHDRGTVHNALFSSDHTWGVDTIEILSPGAGNVATESALVQSENVDDINAIIVITSVDDQGGVTGVSISKKGDYAEDMSGTYILHGQHGQGFQAQITCVEELASNIYDIVSPQENDRAIVLFDEVHSNIKYVWGYMDYNGDGVCNWVPIAPLESLPRDFFLNPITVGEIATGAVTTEKILNGAVTPAKLDQTWANSKANVHNPTFTGTVTIPDKTAQATNAPGAVASEYQVWKLTSMLGQEFTYSGGESARVFINLDVMSTGMCNFSGIFTVDGWEYSISAIWMGKQLNANTYLYRRREILPTHNRVYGTDYWFAQSTDTELLYLVKPESGVSLNVGFTPLNLETGNVFVFNTASSTAEGITPMTMLVLPNTKTVAGVQPDDSGNIDADELAAALPLADVYQPKITSTGEDNLLTAPTEEGGQPGVVPAYNFVTHKELMTLSKGSSIILDRSVWFGTRAGGQAHFGDVLHNSGNYVLYTDGRPYSSPYEVGYIDAINMIMCGPTEAGKDVALVFATGTVAPDRQSLTIDYMTPTIVVSGISPGQEFNPYVVPNLENLLPIKKGARLFWGYDVDATDELENGSYCAPGGFSESGAIATSAYNLAKAGDFPKVTGDFTSAGPVCTYAVDYTVMETVRESISDKQDKITSIGSENVLLAPSAAGGQPGLKPITSFFSELSDIRDEHVLHNGFLEDFRGLGGGNASVDSLAGYGNYYIPTDNDADPAHAWPLSTPGKVWRVNIRVNGRGLPVNVMLFTGKSVAYNRIRVEHKCEHLVTFPAGNEPILTLTKEDFGELIIEPGSRVFFGQNVDPIRDGTQQTLRNCINHDPQDTHEYRFYSVGQTATLPMETNSYSHISVDRLLAHYTWEAYEVTVRDALNTIQSNKQNSLAVDGTGTKYPTVDAVNAAINSLGGGGASAAGGTINSSLLLTRANSTTKQLTNLASFITEPEGHYEVAANVASTLFGCPYTGGGELDFYKTAGSLTFSLLGANGTIYTTDQVPDVGTPITAAHWIATSDATAVAAASRSTGETVAFPAAAAAQTLSFITPTLVPTTSVIDFDNIYEIDGWEFRASCLYDNGVIQPLPKVMVLREFAEHTYTLGTDYSFVYNTNAKVFGIQKTAATALEVTFKASNADLAKLWTPTILSISGYSALDSDRSLLAISRDNLAAIGSFASSIDYDFDGSDRVLSLVDYTQLPTSGDNIVNIVVTVDGYEYGLVAQYSGRTVSTNFTRAALLREVDTRHLDTYGTGYKFVRSNNVVGLWKATNSKVVVNLKYAAIGLFNQQQLSADSGWTDVTYDASTINAVTNYGLRNYQGKFNYNIRNDQATYIKLATCKMYAVDLQPQILAYDIEINVAETAASLEGYLRGTLRIKATGSNTLQYRFANFVVNEQGSLISAGHLLDAANNPDNIAYIVTGNDMTIYWKTPNIGLITSVAKERAMIQVTPISGSAASYADFAALNGITTPTATYNALYKI